MLWSWGTGDPHLVNRGGALLAAIGAAAVVLQVIREMRLEGENECDEDVLAENISPQNREIAEKVLRSRREARRLDRLRMVVTIAGVLVVGEVMHGWGDNIVTWSLHPPAHDGGVKANVGSHSEEKAGAAGV